MPSLHPCRVAIINGVALGWCLDIWRNDHLKAVRRGEDVSLKCNGVIQQCQLGTMQIRLILYLMQFFFYDEKGKKNFITVRWEAKISKHFVLMRVFPETKYLLWFCRLTDGILCFHNARCYRRGMFLFNFYVIFFQE